MGPRAGPRRTGCALALATLALALAVGTASAHKASYSSSLQLQPKPLDATTIEYSGRVNSEAKLCRAGRAVDLFVGGSFLATVFSDGAGNWTATGPLPPKGTEVTAVIKRKVKKGKRHRHRCAADSLTKKAK
jgi:hypothetical protein